MSAYLVANYDVTHPDAYEAYVEAAVPLIEAHGGEVLVAGPDTEVVEGKPGAVTIVIRFPDMEALRAWYDSPDYQEIIPLRVGSTDRCSLVAAHEFVMPG